MEDDEDLFGETPALVEGARSALAELLARGMLIIGERPPDESLIAPGGSAYFYSQWLAWLRQ